MKWVVVSVAATLLAACAAQPPPKSAADGLLASDVPAAGRIRGYVIERRHSDFTMVDGKEIRFEVEYGWDYERGVGVRKTYDAAGRLSKSEDVVGADMPLSEAEVERVRALVRNHPQLKAIAGAPDVRIWSEGFVYRVPGDRYCDKGSRCIHAIIAKDQGLNAVGHAMVDLQIDRVVYPFYDGVAMNKAMHHSTGSPK